MGMPVKEDKSADKLFDRRILLIEDQFLIRMDLQCVLEDRGASVTSAPSVSQGLKILTEEDFDLAVLDVHLPDGDVYPIATQLQEREVPIVFHSGHARAEELQKVFPSSVALSKPASDQEIVAAVKSQLRRLSS